MSPDTALFFTVASEAELNELAAGVAAGYATPWKSGRVRSRISNGSTGVLWRAVRGDPDRAQPLALVVNEMDRRRLFGRFAQVRNDLSPLSAWCHLLNPDNFESFDDAARVPSLGGFEAAWVGLIVAEATLLASLPIPKLRSASCFATQSYAIARTRALWPKTPTDEICDRLYFARQLTRNNDAKLARLRQALEPIWAVLTGLSANGSVDSSLRPMIFAIQSLSEARAHKIEREADGLASNLMSITPEAELLQSLPTLRPEERLKLFDRLTGLLPDRTSSSWHPRDTAIAFLAGYLATVAAGGASSLGLVNANGADYPQVAAWAYVLGGIGEQVTWTASFDGLGRLVARELVRSFRLDEPPDCDFSLDEALILADPELNDALVHLRIKQGRNLAVEIYPGVNVTVPVQETASQKSNAYGSEAERLSAASEISAEEALSILARFVQANTGSRSNEKSVNPKSGSQRSYSGKSRRGGKTASDSTLPLPKPERW